MNEVDPPATTVDTAVAPGSALPRSAGSRRWALLVPALAALLLFFPILDAGFVYDDQVLLENNPAIRSWSAVGEGFSKPFWLITDDSRRQGAGFYRPLPIAVYTLLWKTGAGSPLPFHLASWLLHAACASILARLALRMGWRPLAAAAAGLLFAVHGSHAEAVAWASSMPDLLATCFSLLAIGAMVRGRALGCALWLLPALLSKEAALGPLLLCLCAGMYQKGNRARYATALGGVVLVVYVLRFLAFDSWLAGFDREIIGGMNLETGQRITESLSVLARYCGFLVWPWPHAPFHPMELGRPAGDFASWGPAVVGALFLGCALAVWAWRSRKCILVRVPLGLWVASLLPVLNLQALGQYPFEERFLYLPSAGFVLLAVGLLLGRRGRTGSGPLSVRARFACTVILAVCVGNTFSAAVTLKHWSSSERFFRWAVEASPNAMTSWLGQGSLQLSRAQSMPTDGPARVQALLEARKAFARGLAVDPDQWLVITIDREQGNVGLANSYFLLGDVANAQQMYRQILGRWPESVEAHLGLAATLATEGDGFFGRGMRPESEVKFEEALPHYEAVLAVLPNSTEALHGLGACFTYLERFSEGITLLERAVELRPEEFLYAKDLAESQSMEALMNPGFDPKSPARTIQGFLDRNPQSPYRELALQLLAAYQ